PTVVIFSINTVGVILGAGKPFFMQLCSAQIPRKSLYFYFAINRYSPIFTKMNILLLKPT
ncbi:hypothetical protein, partial [Bacillus cereus]|uniref:hypothetical protein n=1 Tax=Bacillus cereus TaxID=1396 RepID=UPI001F272260